MILDADYIEFILSWVKHTRGVNDWARMGKVVEEVGEVAEALTLFHGLNPRKQGSVRAWDIANEYGDVIMTSLVAIIDLGFNPNDVLQAQREKTAGYL